MKENQTLSGPFPSKNAGEEFVRVDETSESKGPFLQKKTGFYPIREGGYNEAIELIKSGKFSLKLGAMTRNGVAQVQLIDNSQVTEVGEPAQGAETLQTA